MAGQPTPRTPQKYGLMKGLLTITLQGINISHLGKRKIIFKMPFLGGYVSSLEGKFPLVRTLVNPHLLKGVSWG